MNNHLIAVLIHYKILNSDRSLNPAFARRLNANPELVQKILSATSFLRYSAPLKARLHCILQGITSQPTCKKCDAVLEMRLDGKFRYTFAVYCGSKCFSSESMTKEKRANTNIEKYGDISFRVTDIGKERAKQTFMKKYGVDNPLKSADVRSKVKRTNIDRYGVDNPFKSHDVRNKAKQTSLERYGVDNPLKSADVRSKIKQTNLERHGVDNPFKSAVFQQKANDTMLERYGATHPFQVKQIRDKFSQTMFDRYGFEHALQYKEFVKRMKATMIERYGVESMFELERVQEKSKQTSADRYGVEYAAQKHYTDTIISNLNNPNWLHEQHHELEKTLSKIAEELGLAQSTVGLYFKKYNVEVLSRTTSQFERDVKDYISTLYDGTIICNSRSIIPPLELDIYLPDKHLAVECNGVFWHSEQQGKYKKYHLEKTNAATKQGIRLIHIQDNEWNTKREIVQSRISSLIGINNVIYARHTDVVKLTSEDANLFFQSTHIQGNAASSVAYGLVHNGTLVAGMSFSKARFNKKIEWELIRFSNSLNTTVIGGASKLFKHFVKTHSPTSVVSYSDKRWNTGGVYTQIGFSYSHTADPNYYYFTPSNTDILYHRVTFQKHKLSNILGSFAPTMSEWENMVANGYDRIWDCGNDVFIWRQ